MALHFQHPDGTYTPVLANPPANPMNLPIVDIPDVVPDLQELKVITLAYINTAFEREAKVLTAGYPAAETLTWPDQQREASAYALDNAAATPFLDALAAARGISRVDYITKTIAKVNAFKAASAALVGKRQKLSDQIQAATTKEELLAVAWD